MDDSTFLFLPKKPSQTSTDRIIVIPFQILRIQSPTGTKRLEIAENACLRDLFESVHSLFDLDNFEFALFKERNNKDEVS